MSIRRDTKLTCVALAALLLAPIILRTHAGLREPGNQTYIVISERIERGSPIYKLNGKRVEDTRENGLITNLAEIVQARGTHIPVIIIIDVRAPFTEVGKLETALDKADLSYGRKIYVTDFRGGTMNEIHWDEKAIPLPSNY